MSEQRDFWTWLTRELVEGGQIDNTAAVETASGPLLPAAWEVFANAGGGWDTTALSAMSYARCRDAIVVAVTGVDPNGHAFLFDDTDGSETVQLSDLTIVSYRPAPSGDGTTEHFAEQHEPVFVAFIGDEMAGRNWFIGDTAEGDGWFM